MRLRKRLERRHHEGYWDGRDGEPVDPRQFEGRDARYADWAYLAGWHEGRKRFNHLAAVRAAAAHEANPEEQA